MIGSMSEVLSCGLRWAGRGLALLLLMSWGASFVEHLAEWFARPQAASPPPWIWAAQGLHLVTLIGPAIMLRWDRLRAVVTALGTASFFAIIGGHDLPYIALINLLPIACLVAARSLHRLRALPAGSAPAGPSV